MIPEARDAEYVVPEMDTIFQPLQDAIESARSIDPGAIFRLDDTHMELVEIELLTLRDVAQALLSVFQSAREVADSRHDLDSGQDESPN